MQEIDQGANPFPGLRPFESTETHLFFGRDGQSEELLRRLKRTRFLAVVGTSGSGKSSLVRAGLLPALQGGLMASAGSDWRIAILRPGSDPIGNLARALTSSAVLGSRDEKDANMQAVLSETTLRRSSLGLVELVSRARTKLDQQGQPLLQDYENLLVVVDQFEELFRFKQLIENENSTEDAAAFVKLLLEAVGQKVEKIYVVLTMRSDFLGDCSQFWELPEAINNGQYLIPRMTRDERREAISGPVAVGQGAISDPLVNQLLNDVGDNPDQLPILQHALMRTWDYWLDHRHNGNPIDIPDYNAIGGMAEALSQHADEAYAELNDSQKMIAEKLFKGLTEKGADNREIRRPMEVGEICDLTGTEEAAVIDVVEVFRREGRSFLMPPPIDALTGARVPLNRESLIDISHESLIRNWERLKTWVDEESHSARIYKRLAETAMLHRAGEEALLVDPALQGGLDWREENKPTAVWARRYHPEFETGMSYLDASLAARDAELLERQNRQRREVSYKRTRIVAFVLAFSVLFSLASAVYAFRKGALAQRLTMEALMQKQIAQTQTKIAERNAEREAAASRIANEQTELAQAEKDNAKAQSIIAEEQATLARESEIVASAQREIAIREKKMADEAALRNRRLAYAADINLTQQAYESGNVEWARDSLDSLLGHTSAAGDSPGFEWYYLSHLLHSAKETFKPSEGLITVMASPVGDILAIGVGRRVELRTISQGETKPKIIIHLPEHFDTGSLAFSPGGNVLAVGSSQGGSRPTVLLYDLEGGKFDQPIRSFREGGDAANTITFSSDGRRLIVGGGDGSVSLWDVVDSTQKPKEIPDLEGTINLAVSKDTLAIGSVNTKEQTEETSEQKNFPVRLFDMSTLKSMGDLVGHASSVTAVAFASDGKTLATGSADKTVRLWDLERRRTLSVLPFASRVFSLAYSPNGRLLAIGYEDGSIRVCRASRTQECAILKRHKEAVISLSFSAEGDLLFSSDSKFITGKEEEYIRFDTSDETRVKVWDVATLVREQTPVRIRSVAEQNSVRSRTASEQNPVPGRNRGVPIPYSPIAFTSDSKTLAVRDQDKIKLMDAETYVARKHAPLPVSNIATVALSPDGEMVATGMDSLARLWSLSTGKQVGKDMKHGNQDVVAMAFSSDGKLLTTITANGAVKLWDTASQELRATLRDEVSTTVDPDGQRRAVVAFSPDDNLLALIYPKAIEFWDRTQTMPFRVFEIPSADQGPVVSSAFSPDARILAIGYESGEVVLHAIHTFKALATLKVKAVSSLAFSPDGNILATGGGDGTLKLWDWASRRELITLTGHSAEITWLRFSPDGEKLASADSRSLRVWRAPREVNSAVKKPGGSASLWKVFSDQFSLIRKATGIRAWQ